MAVITRAVTVIETKFPLRQTKMKQLKSPEIRIEEDDLINDETNDVNQRAIEDFNVETSPNPPKNATESGSDLPKLSPVILKSLINTLDHVSLSAQGGNDHGSDNDMKFLATISNNLSDPPIFEEAVDQSDGQQLQTVIDSVIDSLYQHGTWDSVNRLPGAHLLLRRFIFTRELNEI